MCKPQCYCIQYCNSKKLEDEETTETQASQIQKPKAQSEQRSKLSTVAEETTVDKPEDTKTKNSEKLETKPTAEKSDKEEGNVSTEEKKSEIEISRQVQDIGNVFHDSKIYFEYVLRKELLQKQEFKELKDVIFQVQIHYIRPDGAKMLRVITEKKPISRSKEEVLKHLNMDLIAANASRKAARLCEEGDYEAARANIYSNALWMNRNAVTEEHLQTNESYMESNMRIDSMMQQQQIQEKSKHTDYKSKVSKKKSRARERGDEFATNMYANKML